MKLHCQNRQGTIHSVIAAEFEGASAMTGKTLDSGLCRLPRANPPFFLLARWNLGD